MSKVDFRSGTLERAYEGLVGVNRSGSNFVRKRVIPKDPQSADQLSYRQAIKELSYWGHRLYKLVLKNTTFGVPAGMSQFNVFMKINKVIRDNKSFAFSDMLISQGKLYNPGLSVINATASGGNIIFSWSTEKQGEAGNGDGSRLVIINENKGTAVKTDYIQRQVGTHIIYTPMSQGDVLHTYFRFYQSGRGVWSTSTYLECIVAV